MNAPLQHVHPQWDTPLGEPYEEMREYWTGRMRIVRNRRRIRLLKKRGVPMLDLRALTERGYVGRPESAWFTEAA